MRSYREVPQDLPTATLDQLLLPTGKAGTLPIKVPQQLIDPALMLHVVSDPAATVEAMLLNTATASVEKKKYVQLRLKH